MSLKMSLAPQAPCIFMTAVWARLTFGIATAPAAAPATVAVAPLRERRRAAADPPLVVPLMVECPLIVERMAHPLGTPWWSERNCALAPTRPQDDPGLHVRGRPTCLKAAGTLAGQSSSFHPSSGSRRGRGGGAGRG